MIKFKSPINSQGSKNSIVLYIILCKYNHFQTLNSRKFSFPKDNNNNKQQSLISKFWGWLRIFNRLIGNIAYDKQNKQKKKLWKEKKKKKPIFQCKIERESGSWRILDAASRGDDIGNCSPT